MDAWASVASAVSDRLGRPVSLLRIDSVVWQAGQHIGKHEPDGDATRRALEEHFEDVGVDAAEGRTLSKALTASI